MAKDAGHISADFQPSPKPVESFERGISQALKAVPVLPPKFTVHDANPPPLVQPRGYEQGMSIEIRTAPVFRPHFTVSIDNPIFVVERQGYTYNIPTAMLISQILPTLTKLRQIWAFG